MCGSGRGYSYIVYALCMHAKKGIKGRCLRWGDLPAYQISNVGSGYLSQEGLELGALGCGRMAGDGVEDLQELGFALFRELGA